MDHYKKRDSHRYRRRQRCGNRQRKLSDYSTIEINGGSVTATGGVFAAGIGSGDNTQGGFNNFGVININGGYVVASASDCTGDPAAIGGGAFKPAGAININGGNVIANGCKKGIGSGAGKTDGTITIKNGYVNANGIGTGNYLGYTSSAGVLIEGGTVICTDTTGGGINTGHQNSWKGIIINGATGAVYGYGNFTLAGDFANNGTFTVPSGSSLTIPAGVTFTNTGTVKNEGNIYNNGTIINGGTLSGNTIRGSGTISDQYSYLSCDENGKNWQNASIYTNWCKVLSASDVSIGTFNTDTWYILTSTVTASKTITVHGRVHLILTNGSTLYATKGIDVSKGNTLTVYAQTTDEKFMGGIEATGGSQCAGIGGQYFSNGGTVIINGGKIKATGGDKAAGIGGGGVGNGTGAVTTPKTVEGIVINGGIVNAAGGEFAAGIGGGNEGSVDGIYINGGSVYAMGGAFGASIGGGSMSSKAVIVITGGTVNAPQPYSAFGFGSGGNGGKNTSLTIYGGVITTGIVGYHGDTTELLGGILIAGEIRTRYNESGWQGVYFGGDNGWVFRNATIDENFEIPQGKTLHVENGRSLTIPAGVTLKVTGGLNVTTGGTLTVNGTVTGSGEIGIHGNVVCSGTYSGNGTVSYDAPAAGEGYTVDYANETVTAKSGYQVSADNFTWQNSVGVVPGSSVYVRKTSVGTGFPPSFAKDNKLGERQSTPLSGVGYLINYSTGLITVRDGYEINTSADFGGSYIADNDSVSAYTEQTLYIRRKAVTTSGQEKFRSEPRPLLVNKSGYSFLYYDENGQNRYTGSINNYVRVNSDTTVWGVSGQNSCYAAVGDITISDRITVLGTVQLILADGCNLNAVKGITVSGGNSLIIYAQSDKTATVGKLNAEGSDGYAGIGSGGRDTDAATTGNITVDGGAVTASTQNYDGNPAAIGGGRYAGAGNITINGGYVTATGYGNAKGIGGGWDAYTGGIIIRGGIVTANGIGVENADINRGTVNTSILGGVVIASGKGINGSNRNAWKGIIFQNSAGTIHNTNSVTLVETLCIPNGHTLTIDAEKTITVPSGTAFVNSGTINCNGTVIINGAFVNDGTVSNNGTISGNGLLCVKESSKISGKVINIGICRPAPLTDGAYRISGAEQLVWFSASVNGILPEKLDTQNAVLTDDIDLNPGYTFNSDGSYAGGTAPMELMPIGTSENRYSGTFDGNGYSISGIYFVRNGYGNFISLFRYLNKGGVIRNLGVSNSYLQGGIYVSGIVGYNEGAIENCYSEANIRGVHAIGGIVGINLESGRILNCYNTGTVTGSGHFAGGIVGQSAGTVGNCCNTGDVTAKDKDGGAGGVCGYQESGTVSGCYSTGNVTGVTKAGSICGHIGGTVGNCYFLKTDTINAGYSDENGMTAKSTEQFGSGEVAWLLNTNGGTAANTKTWSQGTNYPIFADKTNKAIIRVVLTGVKNETFYLNDGDILPGISELVSMASYTTGTELNNDAELVADMILISAAPTITDSIAISYKVNILNSLLGTEAPKMVFTFRGNTYEAEGTDAINNGTYTAYTFTFHGILPQFMCENLKAELTVGTATVGKSEYSVRNYALNILNTASVEGYSQNKLKALKTLVVDLLYYGADSQLYKATLEGETLDESVLATYGLTDAQKTLRTPDKTNEAVNITKREIPANKEYAGYTWDAATFVLKDSISLRFKFTAPALDKLTVKVYIGNTLTETIREFKATGKVNQYQFDFSEISASQLGQSVRLEICLDGEETGSILTYSMNSYICFALGRDDSTAEAKALNTLMRSIYGYEISAAAFKAE